ncbi:MAG: cytochrome b subunit of formate dehydrogenase [Candidatus Latescibacterota bacterium]|jgi:cytochrome b subunit of formate dehydrogenase
MATYTNRARIFYHGSRPVFFCLYLSLAALITTSASANDECFDCHADEELVREGDYRPGSSVYLGEEDLADSPHADLDCIDCHLDASEDHDERLEKADCADCHDDAEEVFVESRHGQALAAGNEDAPTCADCHGAHDIRAPADTSSQVHPQHLALTCATCHADPEFIKRNPVHDVSPLAGYKNSVHYKALLQGDGGATCKDCHESHALLDPRDPRSSIHRTNISETCGTCHEDIQTTYEASAHGLAALQGDFDAPTCTDCHGEHEIRAASDPLSTIYPNRIASTTCSQCHENERIARRHGLEIGRSLSYNDTYHGMAVEDGSVVTAHCASCHGIHNIMPSDNPQSTIHPNNLQATCGECHPNAGKRFAEIPVHNGAGTSGNGNGIAHIVRQVYLALIFGVIGGMLAHNALIIVHAIREKYRRSRTRKTYVRLNGFQIAQHTTMVISFTALVFTGFALKFSDAWWVEFLSWTGMEEAGRRIIHRIAGVVMMAQSVIYLFYLLFYKAGRQELRALAPTWQDLKDVQLNMRHHLGWTDEKPAYDRYNYIEKSEFWALAWGVAIMGLSGLVLWFPEQTTRFLPALAINIGEIVHYYEAWLATLAIVVWHFFYVIFYPGEYPLNITCLDGRVDEDDMAAHHPRELERLRDEEMNRDRENDSDPSQD